MPYKNAIENLNNFGRALNRDNSRGPLELEFDENNTCIIGIDDKFSVHFTFEPNSDQLYIYAPLKDGFPRGEAQFQLFQHLLEGSLLGGKMGGCGVGIAYKEELILMHKAIDMHPMQSADALTNYMPLFVQTVEQWRKECAQFSDDLSSSSNHRENVPSIMRNMINENNLLTEPTNIEKILDNANKAFQQRDFQAAQRSFYKVIVFYLRNKEKPSSEPDGASYKTNLKKIVNTNLKLVEIALLLNDTSEATSILKRISDQYYDTVINDTQLKAKYEYFRGKCCFQQPLQDRINIFEKSLRAYHAIFSSDEFKTYTPDQLNEYYLNRAEVEFFLGKLQVKNDDQKRAWAMLSKAESHFTQAGDSGAAISAKLYLHNYLVRNSEAGVIDDDDLMTARLTTASGYFAKNTWRNAVKYYSTVFSEPVVLTENHKSFYLEYARALYYRSKSTVLPQMLYSDEMNSACDEAYHKLLKSFTSDIRMHIEYALILFKQSRYLECINILNELQQSDDTEYTLNRQNSGLLDDTLTMFYENGMFSMPLSHMRLYLLIQCNLKQREQDFTILDNNSDMWINIMELQTKITEYPSIKGHQLMARIFSQFAEREKSICDFITSQAQLASNIKAKPNKQFTAKFYDENFIFSLSSHGPSLKETLNIEKEIFAGVLISQIDDSEVREKVANEIFERVTRTNILDDNLKEISDTNLIEKKRNYQASLAKMNARFEKCTAKLTNITTLDRQVIDVSELPEPTHICFDFISDAEREAYEVEYNFCQTHYAQVLELKANMLADFRKESCFTAYCNLLFGSIPPEIETLKLWFTSYNNNPSVRIWKQQTDSTILQLHDTIQSQNSTREIDLLLDENSRLITLAKNSTPSQAEMLGKSKIYQAKGKNVTNGDQANQYDSSSSTAASSSTTLSPVSHTNDNTH